MSIRTSGYYKPKEIGDELIPNSDFENQLEGWSFSGWKDYKMAQWGVECTCSGGNAYIWQDRVIEVYPDDLFLVGVCTYNVTKPLYAILHFTNKWGEIADIPTVTMEYIPANDFVNTKFKLVSVSEVVNEYGGLNAIRLFRGVTPYIKILSADGWNINDVFTLTAFSLRRVNPDWFKVFPVMLYKIYEPTTSHTLGTYYSEEYFTGIFNKGEYNLALTYIEETGGSNSITLSVTIQSYDQAGNIWYDAVVFDDVVVAAGTTVQNKVYTKIATAGLGFKQRVKMALSGSGTCGGLVLNVSSTYKQ